MKSNIENVEYRSGYGDMHAHRGALMMAEHVALLSKHNLIDEHMAVELLKPYHQERQYTRAYLEMHPNYTGVQPEMTSLSTAERHQKQRDEDLLKFVEDYEAGRIDEDGNPVSLSGDAITQDTVVNAPDSGSDGNFTNLETDPPVEMGDPPKVVLPVCSHNPASKSSLPAAIAEPSSPSSAASNVSALSSAFTGQSTKRKHKVEPLQPLPSSEDYSQYKYYQLLAVCRERLIYSMGDTQDVRNCLIQDDINIAQGLPRDFAKHKAWKRKGSYKTEVPEALKRDSEKNLKG